MSIASEIISKTNSAIIGDSRKSHSIAPLYSEEFKAILDAIATAGKIRNQFEHLFAKGGI